MRYEVFAVLPGGMGMPRYEGSAIIHAEDELEAIQRARRAIKEVHDEREIKINKIERLHHE